MTRVKGDKRANGPIIYLLMAATLFTLGSVMYALSTADKCGDLNASKEWKYLPPHWECTFP